MLRKNKSIRINDYEVTTKIHWSPIPAPLPTAEAADLTFNIMFETQDLQGQYSVKIEVFPPQSYATLVSSPCTSNKAVLTLIQNIILGPDTALQRLYLEAELTSSSQHYQTHLISVSGSIMNPYLWTAETPYQYLVIISLIDEHAQEVDVESCCFGIKEVSISGPENQLLINGVPILIAGVNHHEFHPITGRSVSYDVMKSDALLLKEFNFNAVRLSHYPHHHYWLELCNKYGLYVIDECNIETHGFQWSGQAVGYLSSQPSWFDAHLSRMIRMYERDKNMTAIIGWSLGNESGVGEAHRKMYRWVKERDRSGRFVQYESGGATSEVTDIICPMYLRPDWCKEKSLNDPKKRPVILCEYAHAMGNSSGKLYLMLVRELTSFIKAGCHTIGDTFMIPYTLECKVGLSGILSIKDSLLIMQNKDVMDMVGILGIIQTRHNSVLMESLDQIEHLIPSPMKPKLFNLRLALLLI